MAKQVNLEALRGAEVHTDPWRWAHYEGAFLEPGELANTYPAPAMVRQPQRGYVKDDTGVHSSEWYNDDTKRTLIAAGAREPCESSGLAVQWLEVAADLLSADYREALSKVVGFDLSHLKIHAVFHMFAERYSCRPHLDETHEKVAHLLYLDGPGGEGSGGNFQVLSSGDMKDLAAEVPPVANQSIVQVRTDRSWHAVSPATAGKTVGRKMLHVTWEEGADTGPAANSNEPGAGARSADPAMIAREPRS